MQSTAPYSPTLLYPDGGEVILSNEIVIRWEIPNPIGDSEVRTIDYEVYYTDQYDPLKEPDWKQIAVVPYSTSQFVWRFGSGIRSSKCRVAIRSRNTRGERSDWSISASDFSINRKKLESPTIITPMNGERYDKTVEVATDDNGIAGTYSERSFYQFYFSSVEANVPLTPIAQNVPIGSGPVIWTTINLPPAKDYVIQAYLADDDGNVSDSVFIRDLEIAHEGFFVIDTTPPVASIVINNNDTFTRDRDVTVTVVSYDEATAVHAMQLKDGASTSAPESAADITHYKLSEGDDIKSVELLLQDFGANRNDGQIQRLFETIVEVDSGVQVVDIAIDQTSSTAWAITSSPYNYLYKIASFPSLVLALEDEPTAVVTFGSYVYIGVKDTTSKGTLMQYNGYEATAVKEFTEADSIINAMAVHKNTLFIGFENGLVYSFDGLTFRKLNGVSNPVKFLVSDGSLLYLTERNGTDVYVYNGTEFVSTGAE